MSKSADWSGIRESNPPLQLGKLPSCRWTNSADAGLSRRSADVVSLGNLGRLVVLRSAEGVSPVLCRPK